VVAEAVLVVVQLHQHGMVVVELAVQAAAADLILLTVLCIQAQLTMELV
jgi:hypothetical protein